MKMLKGRLLKVFNKDITVNIIDLLFFIVVIAIISFSTSGFSQTIDTLEPEQNIKKLDITADSLVANPKKQQVVFSGQVVALYDLTTISSDKLQVFYNDQADGEKFNKESVRKIIASGNVNIELEDKNAKCDKAVYLTSSNSIVLTGEEAVIQGENSSITGTKITIYQNTGQIIVDGSDNKRVNAVFQPDEKNSITDMR